MLTNYGTPVVAIGDDIADLVALRSQIEDWLADHRIEQWERGGLTEDVVTEQVVDREWYVLRRAGRLVAALRVLWGDPDLGEDASDDAIVVDTIMVDREWGGGDVGAALLDWAGALGAFGERSWLRVDCRADNERLAAYYESQGFVRVPPGEHADGPADLIRFHRHT